jgi:hypothetical protein
MNCKLLLLLLVGERVQKSKQPRQRPAATKCKESLLFLSMARVGSSILDCTGAVESVRQKKDEVYMAL